MSKLRILSGIQATGKLTLGNYLGAINNWVKMQDNYDCYYMIADLHTLTVRNDPDVLRKNTLNLIALYIAAGLDPENNTIFIQSHIKEHSELAWILNCYTYIGELSRMTQFKDKSLKHEDNINSGLFTYPVLMAADILLYKTDLVPVGQDQKQHLEITRDIAQRFNKKYGDTFIVPGPYIQGTGAKIMGLQNPTAKMSKTSINLNDVIFLDDTVDNINLKLKKAVTDSENIVRFDPILKPGVSNLMSIYSSITGSSIEKIEQEFLGKGYGKFKSIVADAVIEKLRPIQNRYRDLKNNNGYLEEVYKNGARQARLIARRTLRNVKRKIGLII